MSEPIDSRRRLVLTGTLGIAAAAASTSLLGQVTPSQVEGPFYPIVQQADMDADLTRVKGRSDSAAGEVVIVAGRVTDEAGAPIEGAVVDVWQANSHGRYAHERDPNPAPLDPNFQGWAKIVTNADGRYRFRTIKPGSYAVNETQSRPPHIHFKVSRRGYRELTTQMYFAGEPLNETDSLLQSLTESEQAQLVVDFLPSDGAASREGRFDVILAAV